MKIWVISDTHWNHDNVIMYSDRPFSDVREMNETMIALWNERVAEEDLVYHLGDVFYPPKKHNHLTLDELAARLHGRKILIRGNHDTETRSDEPKVYDHWMWDEVHDYLEVKFGKSRFVLCHYPLETWRNAHRGWFMLHGHCHGTLKRTIPHRADVGVDVLPDFGPISLEEVRDILNSQDDYVPQDHHGERGEKYISLA